MQVIDLEVATSLLKLFKEGLLSVENNEEKGESPDPLEPVYADIGRTILPMLQPMIIEIQLARSIMLASWVQEARTSNFDTAGRFTQILRQKRNFYLTALLPFLATKADNDGA